MERNIALCILLSIVTCGIYGIYWFVVITDEINYEAGDATAASGGMSLLLTCSTCGIYGLFWAYKMGEKVDAIKMRAGVPSSNSGVLFLILGLFGLSIVTYALIQDTINKYTGPMVGYGSQKYDDPFDK